MQREMINNREVNLFNNIPELESKAKETPGSDLMCGYHEILAAFRSFKFDGVYAGYLDSITKSICGNKICIVKLCVADVLKTATLINRDKTYYSISPRDDVNYIQGEATVYCMLVKHILDKSKSYKCMTLYDSLEHAKEDLHRKYRV